jgi:hypothetical protein
MMAARVNIGRRLKRSQHHVMMMQLVIRSIRPINDTLADISLVMMMNVHARKAAMHSWILMDN